MKSEFELIKLLRKKIPRKMQGKLGIGDDAAVLPGPGAERLLFTTDILVEGVDFIRRKTPAAHVGAVPAGYPAVRRMVPPRPELVGRKAVAVNLSDIAAMGGTPYAFVVSLGIPRNMNQKWILKFYDGVIALARQFGVLCVGGDISRAREFFVSIAMIGRARPQEIVTRRGARAGDWIAVTGKLGGSIFERHLTFEPRVKEARFLARRFHPTSMIDLSDGLVQDLGHILQESSAGAKLNLNKIPVSRDALKLAHGNSEAALRHALTDGEDFELLFTISGAKKKSLDRAWKRQFPRLKLSWVGKIAAAKQSSQTAVADDRILWTRDGKPAAAPRLAKKGFSHF